MKFVRRPDLTTATRIHIAMLALLCQGTYGGMSELANQYAISRTFLYQLLNSAVLYLSICFSDCQPAEKPRTDRHWHALVLLLRLEGQCSLSSITEILRYQGITPSCHGTLSERFKVDGAQLPSTLTTEQPCYVVYLSDELFACHRPILITIEPTSTAILRIELAADRSAATWQQHFQQLHHHHYRSLALASDRGTGLVTGYHTVHPDTPWYADHFHELRALYQHLTRIENQAYALIDHESECLRKFNNARSSNNLHKRLADYEHACARAQQRIADYDQLNLLVGTVRTALQFFDAHGRPQQPQTATETLQAAFDLMREQNDATLNTLVNTLGQHLDELTACLTQAQRCYTQLTDLVPSEARDFLCLAWQHLQQTHHTKSTAKHYHQQEGDFWLSCAEPLVGPQATTVIHAVFDRLDTLVRASSLVEMVNSHIRPYLDHCKGQITQETLNLIMFYHNHRRYKSGKRQGHAPIEILTGQPLDQHWVELLIDTLDTAQAA